MPEESVVVSSVCCASVTAVVGVTSSMRLASAPIWPQVSGTLVAHNASAASATPHAIRGLLNGAMLEWRGPFVM